LRGFLGLTGYYRDFILRYSHIAKPLTQLLKEDQPWLWGATCQTAFQQLKSCLTSAPILAMPEFDRPFTIHCDFSAQAISAVLEQLKADNKSHVICYASRTCSLAESKLGPTDGELAAMVYAVEKFHCYVAGTKFIIVTDHAALVHLQEARSRNPKLARWAMRLSCYDFTVKHRPGRIHNNADGLSRARSARSQDEPAPDQTAIEAAHIDHDPDLLLAALEAMEADDFRDDPTPLAGETPAVLPTLPGPRQLLLEAAPCAACHQDITGKGSKSLICDRCNAAFHLRCTSLRQVPATYWFCATCQAHIRARGISCPTEDLALQHFLLSGHAPPALLPAFRSRATDLSFTDRLYCWKAGKWLPYPPKGLQLLLMEEVHTHHQHVGGEKLYHLLAANYFWPSMKHDCTSFVQHCFECQLSAGRPHGSW